ncbi:hypothetical protein GGR14_001482 [Butyricimonas faecihominis]|uniref:Uncharacterized protein n=1 Tax=Butyricimonas faecihominis TaxID=1472416 RepID=A0A7W6HWI0_9BACT|nr:hypothetical protein [Butyricimonas faecihominis]
MKHNGILWYWFLVFYTFLLFLTSGSPRRQRAEKVYSLLKACY